MAQIHETLIPGGRLVFSGWTVDSASRKSWLLNNYLVEGQRITNWLGKGVVKYHRTLATTVNTLVKTGFSISRIEEWGPTDEQIAGWPELANERQRPTFLLVSARA